MPNLLLREDITVKKPTVSGQNYIAKDLLAIQENTADYIW